MVKSDTLTSAALIITAQAPDTSLLFWTSNAVVSVSLTFKIL